MKPSRLLIWAALLAGVAVFSAPLAWMLVTTMKLDHELVRRPVRWLPDLPAVPMRGPWTDEDGHEHRLGLGRIFAVTSSGEELALPVLSPWQGPGDSPFASAEADGTAALALWDYALPPGNPGQAVCESRHALPVPRGEIDHWLIEVGNDLSFHEMWFTVQTAEHIWASTPHALSTDEGQDLILRRAEDPALGPSDLALISGRAAAPDPPEGEVVVRAVLHRSSLAQATWLKFTEQYRRALDHLDFWAFTRNSVFLVVLNVVGAVLSCSLVAYSFARLQWVGRDLLFLLLLSTMMLPPQVTMVPQFLVWRGLGAYDTLVPLWVPAFLSVPFFVFLLRQFMLTIPKDLEDAARIDGCSAFGIWGRITLPLIRPALIAVAIFQFLWTWNDFMGPLIYVANPQLQPLSVGIYIFKQAFAGQWGMILAASSMMLLPVLVMFFCAQRHFIEGVTLTGLKA